MKPPVPYFGGKITIGPAESATWEAMRQLLAKVEGERDEARATLAALTDRLRHALDLDGETSAVDMVDMLVGQTGDLGEESERRGVERDALRLDLHAQRRALREAHGLREQAEDERDRLAQLYTDTAAERDRLAEDNAGLTVERDDALALVAACTTTAQRRLVETVERVRALAQRWVETGTTAGAGVLASAVFHALDEGGQLPEAGEPGSTRALFDEAFDIAEVGYPPISRDFRDELYQALAARGRLVPEGAEVVRVVITPTAWQQSSEAIYGPFGPGNPPFEGDPAADALARRAVAEGAVHVQTMPLSPPPRFGDPVPAQPEAKPSRAPVVCELPVGDEWCGRPIGHGEPCDASPAVPAQPDTQDLLAEQFGAVTDASSTDVPMRAHTDQEDR